MKNLSKLTILAMMSLSLNAWAGEDVTTLATGEQVTKSESFFIANSVIKTAFVSDKSAPLVFRLTGINFNSAIKYKTVLAGEYSNSFLDYFWPSKSDDIDNLRVVVSKKHSTISFFDLSGNIPTLVKEFKSKVTTQDGVMTLNILLEEENMDSHRLTKDYFRELIISVAELKASSHLLPDRSRFKKFRKTFFKTDSKILTTDRISTKYFVCVIREDDKKTDSNRMTCSVNLIITVGILKQ